MRRLINLLPVLVPAVLLIGLAGWFLTRPREPAPATAAGEWTCSMHPQVRRPAPGQCPICGMNLVPIESLAAEQAQTERRIGVETEPATHRELFREVRTVGKLDYNESRVAYITARIAGRVDRLYADFTGIQVKKADHLADIYSPDLFVAQTEYLRAREGLAKAGGDRTFAEANLDAARSRLRLLGILDAQIAELEREGKVRTHLTIFAPIGGTVVEKTVRAGQYVKEGDPLYRIADLDPIWLYLDVYEFDLAWVRYGQAVEVTLEAYPGETFRGVVTFIDPFLDDRTRTIKVRVNLKNPDRRLKPAMYAAARIRARLRADGTPEPTGIEGKYICPMHPEVVRDAAGKCPVCEMPLERVPGLPPTGGHGHGAQVGPARKVEPPAGRVLAVRATAVLNTGRRAVVYRKRPDGAYEMVEVGLGPRAEGKDDAGRPAAYYAVLRGLAAGDQVVVRGGFLLDSQRQIEGMPSLLYPEGQSAANLHAGHGGPAATPEHKH
ncbi:MAG TPA: efflux RND transporter periplasmic adaptor subunit [Gemmataceae bacterium]|nr:efflux RND transporter periplasmic adaptor subunit [Gemmataceae bacterium]